MITLIHAENAVSKIQHPCMIKKNLEQIRYKITYLNIIETTYGKPTAKIMLNREKLKAFLLKSGTRQGCPLSPLLFNMLLKALARVIRQ
jgi:hypothetical protein